MESVRTPLPLHRFLDLASFPSHILLLLIPLSDSGRAQRGCAKLYADGRIIKVIQLSNVMEDQICADINLFS